MSVFEIFLHRTWMFKISNKLIGLDTIYTLKYLKVLSTLDLPLIRMNVNNKCFVSFVLFLFIPLGIQGARGFDGVGYPGSQGIPGKPGPAGIPGKLGIPGLPGVCDLSMCYQTYDVRDSYSKGPNI